MRDATYSTSDNDIIYSYYGLSVSQQDTGKYWLTTKHHWELFMRCENIV